MRSRCKHEATGKRMTIRIAAIVGLDGANIRRALYSSGLLMGFLMLAARVEAKDLGDLPHPPGDAGAARSGMENPHHWAMYQTAKALSTYFAVYYPEPGGAHYEHAARLCGAILKENQIPGEISRVTALLAEIEFKRGQYATAAALCLKNENHEAAGIALYSAGELQEARKAFEKALAHPLAARFDCPVGETPRAARMRIWLARCLGKAGDQKGARQACYEVVTSTWYLRRLSTRMPGYEVVTKRNENSGSESMWARDDQVLRARVLIENSVGDKAAMAELKAYAWKTNNRWLKDYFSVTEAITDGRTGIVAAYLAGVPRESEPAWQDEVLAQSCRIGPSMVQYEMSLLREARDGDGWIEAGGTGPAVTLYGLRYLLKSFPDTELVGPILEYPDLMRSYPDDYRVWMDDLRPYTGEIKKAVFRLLRGGDREREHAFFLVDGYELFYKDILDAVFDTVQQPYHPTDTLMECILWKVTCRDFDLTSAGGGPRAEALSAAASWWRETSNSLKATDRVANRVDDQVDVLRETLKRERANQEQQRGNALILEHAWKKLAELGDPAALAHAYGPVHLVAPFMRNPSMVLEWLIRRRSYAWVTQWTGVSFSEKQAAELDQAWEAWWEKNKPYYDFGRLLQ
ncbi:MAG: hypothetical protein HYU36_05525 [Planctomycetes bacterium]|nr:hypothetical protein [Planctomycetota bacterium]